MNLTIISLDLPGTSWSADCKFPWDTASSPVQFHSDSSIRPDSQSDQTSEFQQSHSRAGSRIWDNNIEYLKMSSFPHALNLFIHIIKSKISIDYLTIFILPIGTDVALPLSSLVGEISRGT